MKTATTKAMAQRKQSTHPHSRELPLDNGTIMDRVTYGVPAEKRMLSPGLLLKKHYRIKDYLTTIGLTSAEREVAFYLLRLFAYYGKVYPKAPNYTEDCYISKRSFWRAIAKLQDAGQVDRIHRYLNHLQISNSYRLDKLVLCLIRYLAEHGVVIFDKFAGELLRQTNFSFWQIIRTVRVRLRDPIPLSFEA